MKCARVVPSISAVHAVNAVIAVPAVAALAIACAGIAPALAQQSPGCKPVLDAMLKVAVTDHRLETTADGTTGQIVASGGAIYVNRGGKWTRSPMTMAQQQAQEKENIADTKVYSCAPAPAVAGAAGTAWHIHSETEDHDVTDGTIVIGPNGLPVQSDYTIKTDGRARHYVSRYSYDNVRAPI